MAEEEKEEQQEEGKKGGKKKFILFGLVGILVLAIAGGVAFFFLGKKGEKKGKEKKKEEVKVEKRFFVTLDPLVVNLLDPSGKRYIQIQIALQVKSPKDKEEIENNLPIIRDTMIDVLSSKTPDDVLEPDSKEKIKKELLEKLNEALGADIIENIYIIQYLVE